VTAPVQHPAWCSPLRCEVAYGGAHSSEPQTVNFASDGPGFCRVRIWQGPPILPDRLPPVVFIELIAGNIDNGQRTRCDLTHGQAMQLGELLAALLAQIGD
jgi:hypothetical protein